MKKIPLTRGKFALVDDEDYEWLMQWKWCARKGSNGVWYAKRGINSGKNTVHMHREIWEKYNRPLNKNEIVDHEDWNGLNNQKKNIQICSKQQNSFRKRVNCGSVEFRGVSLRVSRNILTAQIKFFGKNTHLGVFENTESGKVLAAQVYDIAALELMKNFAILNFTDVDYSNHPLREQVLQRLNK